MYKIFYEKWRPKKFNNIFGQKNIIKYIKNSFLNNKLHHSYIFTGSRGVGKTTIARLFVKLLNCSNIFDCIKNNDFPCCVCENCLLIDKDNFIDFIEINGSVKSSVDDIKELLNNIIYYPIKSKYKIYMIDEIHMLSKQGFSSLLKILEEPPIYLKFILVTTDIKKIPDTIISRCIMLNFENINEIDIKNNIKYILYNENIKFSENSINIISKFSNGSIRDSLNILEQAYIISDSNYINDNTLYNILNIYDIKYIVDIIFYIINNDKKSIYLYFNKNFLYSINYYNTIDQFIIIIHNIFMYNINNNYILDNYINMFIDKIILMSNKDNIKKIRDIYDIIINKDVKNYVNNKIKFETYILYILHKVNN